MIVVLYSLFLQRFLPIAPGYMQYNSSAHTLTEILNQTTNTDT